ncbi:hypothetical protein BGX26_012487 [Mortierella sp. AD094]|nr:hypothetical protein BGX26_012487 [Mortierella sp. AD094]
MLLSTNPTMKLVSLTLAALTYAATSVTAAPVITLNAKVLSTQAHGASDIECVKVIAPGLIAVSSDASDRPVVVDGEKIPIKIDALACDPALTNSAQPWMVTLVNKSRGEQGSVKLADIAATNQNDYNWIVNAPHTQNVDYIDNLDLDGHDNAESVKPEYFIKVQAKTDDGQQRLVGKTDTFVIVNTSTLQKRKSPELEVSSAPETTVADDSLPGPPKADTTDDIDTSISALPAASAPAFPTTPEESNPEITQSLVEDPAANVDPSILAAPALEVPQTPSSPQVPSSGSISPSFGPTYPNVPDVPADSPDLPKPLNPPFIPQTNEPTPQPKTSRFDVFYKYAAAGGALLSLIGLGVGGIVGGVIGGTVGLVLGLALASINTLILG